jgi:FixJ family two-component response regulator
MTSVHQFLTKPFREQDLLDAIQSGLERDRSRREKARSIADLQARFNALTPREREVMAHAVTGRLNKQIAAEIGVSENTVKIHRGNILRKMEAASLVELALMAENLKKSSPGKS